MSCSGYEWNWLSADELVCTLVGWCKDDWDAEGQDLPHEDLPHEQICPVTIALSGTKAVYKCNGFLSTSKARLNTANDVNAAAKNGQYNLKEAKQMLSYRKHDAGMLIA